MHAPVTDPLQDIHPVLLHDDARSADPPALPLFDDAVIEPPTVVRTLDRLAQVLFVLPVY